MKRILFFLSLAVLLTACGGKDKINFKESDLIGTWTHVKNVNAFGAENVNLADTKVLKANHECVTYYSMTSDNGTWELNGRELNIGGAKSTISKLDGTHLTITFQEDKGTYTDTYIKIEPLLTGTWTVSWTLGDIMYVTFNPDGTAVWKYAKTGNNIGTYEWNVGVDDYYSRPAINYSGPGVGQDTIMAASDDEFRVIDNNGKSGVYARGKLAVQ